MMPVNMEGDELNTTLFQEDVAAISPTSVISGWCYSKDSEVLLTKLGISANIYLQDDVMKVLGKR